MRLQNLIIFAFCLQGCSRSLPPENAETSNLSQVAEPADYKLRALTQVESAYLPGLEAHMAFLSEKLGRREPLDAWTMADSADYIAAQFSEAGYPPEWTGFELKGSPLQNLAVTIPGGVRGNEVVLVVVHYDSPAGPGQEPIGAAATAILLELAKDLRKAKLSRTIKLVALAVGEAPYLAQNERGSLYYLQQLLKDKGQSLLFSIHMDHLAAFSPGSVKEQPALAPAVLLEVSPGAADYADPLSLAFGVSPFDVKAQAFVSAEHQGTDGETFHQAGLPIIRVSGELKFRGLKLEEMAIFTSIMRTALGKIALEEAK